MLDYKLREDEVVLYKGFVTLTDTGETKQLLLTNLNLVFISKYKKLNADTEVFVDTMPVGEIKIYQEEPQIKVKGTSVEIYFLTKEIEFDFTTKSDLHKFMHEIKDLLSGKTKQEIKAEKKEKVKKTIGTSAKIAGVMAGFLATKSAVGGIIGGVASGVTELLKKSEDDDKKEQ